MTMKSILIVPVTLLAALAAGVAVAIDAARVGAASWTNDLALRRSWTRTPAASAARSVMGTMSVDFMVMGQSSILPKES